MRDGAQCCVKIAGTPPLERRCFPGYVGRAIVWRMGRFDRITVDPRKMNGQPCVRGLRLTVRRVLEALATYPDRDEFRREYPELDDADIRQVLEYAAAMLDDRVTDLPAA